MTARQVVLNLLVSGLMLGSVAVWLSIARRISLAQPLVAYEPRPRVPWNGLDVVWLVIFWPVLEVLSLRLVGAEVLSTDGWSASALAAVTAAHLVWSLAAVAFLRLRTGARADEMGFDTGRWRRDVWLGVVTFLAAAPVVYTIQLTVAQFWPPDEHPLVRLVNQRPGGGLLALAGLSAVVVAPLSEELLFRVVLQRWLESALRGLRRRSGVIRRWHRGAPIFVSSAVFAVMHQGSDQVALFVLALFLGLVYRQTHRIWPSLVVHACVNALAVAALALGEA